MDAQEEDEFDELFAQTRRELNTLDWQIADAARQKGEAEERSRQLQGKIARHLDSVAAFTRTDRLAG